MVALWQTLFPSLRRYLSPGALEEARVRATARGVDHYLGDGAIHSEGGIAGVHAHKVLGKDVGYTRQGWSVLLRGVSLSLAIRLCGLVSGQIKCLEPRGLSDLLDCSNKVTLSAFKLGIRGALFNPQCSF